MCEFKENSSIFQKCQILNYCGSRVLPCDMHSHTVEVCWCWQVCNTITSVLHFIYLLLLLSLLLSEVSDELCWSVSSTDEVKEKHIIPSLCQDMLSSVFSLHFQGKEKESKQRQQSYERCLAFSSAILWNVCSENKERVDVFCLHDALLVRHKPLDYLFVPCGVPDGWGAMYWRSNCCDFYIQYFPRQCSCFPL